MRLLELGGAPKIGGSTPGFAPKMGFFEWFTYLYFDQNATLVTGRTGLLLLALGGALNI